MSNKWLVTFIDEGNCEICSIEVTAFRMENASKCARREMTEQQRAEVEKDAVKMTVEKK